MKRITSASLAALLCAAVISGKLVSAAATVQPRSPDAAAQKLYQAWRLKSRKSAASVAEKAAVDKLFSVRWRAMRFDGCKNRDEGGYECVFTDVRNDLSLAMIVEGGASVGGYNVTSLSFSSEG